MFRLIFLLVLAPIAFAEPLRVIVELRGARGDALREFRVRREFRRVLNGAAVEVRDGAELARLRKLPFVERVTMDGEVRAYDLGMRWQDHRFSPAIAAAPRSHSENGVVVAIVDSGIDHRHPAFAGRIIGGWDFVNDDADPMDDFRHGTHVAGIVAADGVEVQGIAPRARLLSYKVLNHEGRGRTSDIIAAIDRAVTEEADIINLSLGGPGHADDPLARAVNRAVDAGAVVVVAAGNDGWYHQIGSPGSADKAITVGATEGTTAVAEFSSRGPAGRTGAIKPDLLAPGVGIRSAAIGGGTLVLSGTSMATPHVAGLAALLLEEHPGWTPAQIKSALVTTASPLALADAMTQGSGVVDRDRMKSPLVIAPTQLHFGLDATTGASWSASRSLTLRNASAAPRTVHFGVEGESAGIDVTAPGDLTLAPGESKEVTFAIAVDHEALPALPVSFAYAGAIAIDDARVPWAFLRAGRITITYDEPRPSIHLSSGGATRAVAVRPIEISAVEALVEPALYDVTLVAKDEEGDVRVIIAEQQAVHGDVLLQLAASDATRFVRFDGVDDRGAPFPEGETATTLHHPRARVLVAGGGSVELPVLTKKSIRSSRFSDRFALLATEHFFDTRARRMYVVQHPPLRGLTGDASLRNASGDYARQELHFLFPPDATRRELHLLAREVVRRTDEISRVPRSFPIPGSEFEWRGTAFVTPEVHPDYAVGVALLGYTQHGVFPEQIPSLFTPLVRRDANGFFAQRNFFTPPAPVRLRGGEPLLVNDGPIHPEGTVTVANGFVVLALEMVGDQDEVRRNERYGMRYRLTDPNGTVVGNGNQVDAGSFFADLPLRGVYTLTFTNDRYSIAGRSGTATLTLKLDNTGGPVDLPSLTSFSVVGEEGDVSARLRTGSRATLHVSATAPVRRVSWRRGAAWQELTALEVAENVYRVDLTEAAALDGEVALRVELDGVTWEAGPAFVVGKKRRAAN